LNTLIALPAYGLVRVLLKITPYRASTARRPDGFVPDLRRTCGHPRCKWFVAFLTRCYRRSAVFTHAHRNGQGCRFIPSCSEYAVRAVDKHGLWRGLWMTGGRLRRCIPTYEGDYLDFP